MKKNRMDLVAGGLRLSEALVLVENAKESYIFCNSYYFELEYLHKIPKDEDMAYSVDGCFFSPVSYDAKRDIWYLLAYDNTFSDPYTTLFDSDWEVYHVNKVVGHLEPLGAKRLTGE